MTVRWVKSYSPDLLSQRLEQLKIIKPDNSVSFQGFEYIANVAVLSSMVSFHDNIPNLEKRRIISDATFNAANKGKITPQGLLEEMNELEKQYLCQRPEQYNLITTISIKRHLKLKRHSINGNRITFRPIMNRNFNKGIEQIKNHATYSINGEFPRDYIFAKISVKGKSRSDAGERALDTIDLIRGIWNLFYNRGQYFRMSSGLRKPINKIVLGPLHTLHLPNGKLANELWWYEPDYRGPLDSFDPSREIDNIYRFETSVRKLLKKSPFKSFLETAIIRYTRALDLTDWDNSFLRLWGLLETLSNTGENDSHKVTVKRTSFFYKDREYVKQILNHLKDYRNKAVHTGSGNQEIETYMYQLKQFVETALEFLISNKFGFKDLNEVAQFLDLPDDRVLLNKKKHLINSALKYTRD